MSFFSSRQLRCCLSKMPSETDCVDCLPPANPTKPDPVPSKTQKVLDVSEAGVASQMLIPGLGRLPVIHGVPTWLPPNVKTFVCEMALLMKPSAIFICNGSVFEAELLMNGLLEKGMAQKLNYDNVYLIRTDPLDTARMEKKTFISTLSKNEVEANRQDDKECEMARFMSRSQLSIELDQRFPGCMRGRIMYVVPFCMGPIGDPHSLNAVQITDSSYVVLNMRVMTRVSSAIWDSLAGHAEFVRCIHSVGCPRPITKKLVNQWACNPNKVLIAHLSPEKEVWSYGSGYGGNSLLGKKCLGLRIGSYIGYKEGWLAEHAALVSITDPNGKATFICVSFPSGQGKTALAFMQPSLPGWKIQVLGDDITWLRIGADGVLYGMAPENGMFAIAAGTEPSSGKQMIEAMSRDALLVNTASTSKGRFFWQGLEKTLEEGENVIDWKGETWKVGDKTPPAHPNSRFTVYTRNVPNVHPQFEGKPVPISAYIFGCRRSDAFPLVMESENWSTGLVFAAASRTQTGNSSDIKGDALVHDPMSMRPFLSYNFANYVKHWLSMEKADRKLPKIFHVNWYQQDSEGKFIWPGFNENIRVLEWILARVEQKTDRAIPTPFGHLPTE